MREIKFRAWLLAVKRMTYTHTLDELMNWNTQEEINGIGIWLQYTGLRDKNGTEIYEGDILRHNWNSGNDIMKETISEVRFSDGAFICDDKKRANFDISIHALSDWAEVEVIGNIYENQELLIP